MTVEKIIEDPGTVPRQIPVDEIEVGPRLRTIRDDTVAFLMDSIEECGQHTPITVHKKLGVKQNGLLKPVFHLVTGNHRLEAIRRLGRKKILARVMTSGHEPRRLWEIDENLCRGELNALERAEHLWERSQIFNPNKTGKILPSKGGRGRKGFASDTSERTGISKRQVNQELRRAKKIPKPFRDSIRHTPIAKSGCELDLLASLDSKQQQDVIDLIAQGSADSVRSAIRLLNDQSNDKAPPKKEIKKTDDQILEDLQKTFGVLNEVAETAPPKVVKRFKTWLGHDAPDAAALGGLKPPPGDDDQDQPMEAPALLPTKAEANRIARETGCAVTARDGCIYTGKTDEEEAEIVRVRRQTYGALDAMKLIAGMKPPAEWLADANIHMIHDFDFSCAEKAAEWLLDLAAVVQERAGEMKAAAEAAGAKPPCPADSQQKSPRPASKSPNGAAEPEAASAAA